MIKKIFMTILALIVLLFIVSAVNWHRTKQKLAQYCHETTAGTLVVSAREKALLNGFRFIESSSGDGNRNKALVTASGVMGRFVCEIEHDGKKVIKASMLFND